MSSDFEIVCETVIRKITIDGDHIYHIYDVANQSAHERMSPYDYINKEMTRYNEPENILIFVMNRTSMESFYNDTAINNILRNSPQRRFHKVNNNVYYIFTQDSNQYDDECVIYLALRLYHMLGNKLIINVRTDDDYMKRQHDQIPIYIQVRDYINEMYRHYRTGFNFSNDSLKEYADVYGWRGKMVANTSITDEENEKKKLIRLERFRRGGEISDQQTNDDEKEKFAQFHSETNYKLKYLKYKNKYLKLKKLKEL